MPVYSIGVRGVVAYYKDGRFVEEEKRSEGPYKTFYIHAETEEKAVAMAKIAYSESVRFDLRVSLTVLEVLEAHK